MKRWSTRPWKKAIIPLTMASLVLSAFAPAATPSFLSVNVAHAAKSDKLQDAFAEAAEEFGVPESILLSVSYNLTRWEHHDGKPSFSAGFGLMHLTELDEIDETHGKGLERKKKGDADDFEDDPSMHTLSEAADLLGIDPEELIEDPVQNIRGGAALLAEYAKDTVGELPTDVEDWYGAVAKYSGSKERSLALDFADQVFETINDGVDRETTDGQKVRLKAKKVKANRDTVESLRLHKSDATKAECPNGLDCQFIPALYAQRGNNPSSYGNYDIADRPKAGPEIRYIVIHDTEGSYQSAINWFQNPASSVAAHYVIRSSDGQITQMVNNKDVGWHAGNWYVNMHSIGLEHEGIMLEGADWYTERMYRASAKLVKYLAEKYEIPLDRAHIIAHEEIPGLTQARHKAMHEDPGAFWDWEHYFELLGAPIKNERGPKNVVTIKPHFQTNKPELDGLERQPANFVYLYQEPSFDAPLLDDTLLPGPGSTSIHEEGSKAVTGQTYVLADEDGDWDAIWFGGQKAWFYNPNDKNTVSGKGLIVRPKESNVPVYGAAFPEASAYPSDVPPRNMEVLYRIDEGQAYVVAEKTKGNYYHAVTFSHDPYDDDHKMVIGEEEYYQIYFNHRFGFVKASDVEIGVK
ncbi:MAG TPA: peptidoglycan recognition family protein [Candidatus Bathyarchaeia archaeon]|nr:peptidoglycan recognition family protein [Candidatus Bathyarchaeia archaeon]